LLATILDEIQPASVLDCGSGSEVDRRIVQPQIAAAFQGFNVTWSDLTPSKGVLLCDFTKPETLAALPRCEAVTAMSILEHVTDIDAVLEAVVSLADKWLILSVPRIYPKHDCPIDNLWRPTPQELAEKVSKQGMEVVHSYSTGPERFGIVPNASASVVLAKRSN